MKKSTYTKSLKLKYNKNIFRVIIRDDKKIGFLKIVNTGSKEEYTYPNACEFLHLSSFMNLQNQFKF